jgi:hypothetical protein
LGIAEHLLAGAPRGVEGAAGQQARQVLVERADRRRDRHVVVVEDDQQVGVDHAGVVERLEGLPADIAPSPMIATTRRSSPLLRAATAMPSAAEIEVDEWPTPKVSYSLSHAAREAGHAVLHAQPLHAGAAAGQGLVRIGLVADVPHQAVGRRVEHVVQGDGQFDRAEVGRQMAAGLRHRFERKARSSSASCGSCSRSSARRSAGKLMVSSRGWFIRKVRRR